MSSMGTGTLNNDGMHILVVEDNPTDFLLVQEELLPLLQDSDPKHVTHATHLRDALQCVREGRFDIVLLDVNLPDSEGLRTFENFRKSAPNTPLIVLTGLNDEHLAAQMLSKGAQDYILKGQALSGLLPRTIRYAIERHRVSFELDRRAKELAESESCIRTIIESSVDAMIVVNPGGIVLFANAMATQMFGRTATNLVGQSFGIPTDRSRPSELDILCSDGSTGVAEMRVVETMWSEKPAYLLSLRDSTESKKSLDRLREAANTLLHSAFHDVLTNLPNRALFMDRLEQLIGHAKRQSNYRFAVLFLDLDGFKGVNDSLGHVLGDRLLIEVAHRLKACIRPRDTVARLGGDEFAILLDDLSTPLDPAHVAKRIQTSLTTTFNLDGREIHISASIGMALTNPQYSKPEEILRDADAAMYRAKALGRARHEVFEATEHAQPARRLPAQADLQRAIEAGQLTVQYQPIVSLSTGRLTGFDAVPRCQDPERGWISPYEFMHMPEETELTFPLGEWVLRQACRQMRLWQEQFPGLPELSLSVNLSSAQFVCSDLAEKIKAILDETGMAPARLNLGISESTIMSDPDAAAAVLEQLRAINIQLHMDRFGGGYSSLSHLHRFPLTAVKIDQSFVSRMSASGKYQQIVQAIITLAQSQGLRVMAEGVETPDQLAVLQRVNCEHGQGDLFSKPMETAAAVSFLETAHKSQETIGPSHLFTAPAKMPEYKASGAATNNYSFKLYVNGNTQRAKLAIENLTRICNGRLAGQCDMVVIDVLEFPQLAEEEKILATPTLIKQMPEPERRIIGDLSNTKKVFSELDIPMLEPEAEPTGDRPLEHRRPAAGLAQKAKELAARESRLRTLTDSSADAMIVVDRDGMVKFANSIAAQMFGRSLSGLLRGSFKLPADHSGPSELKILRADGSTGIAEMRVVKTMWDDAHAYLLSLRDITESKKAVDSLRERATLLELGSDAIVGRDLDGRIVFWNKGAELMFGFSREEVMGRRGDELIFSPDQAPALEEARRIVLATGEWRGELQPRDRNNNPIVVSSRWTLLKDDAGRPRAILRTSTDITEKKKIEEQFLRTQRLDSIGVFAGGIAHDCNNLLTAIMMNTTFVGQCLPENHPASHSLEDIQSAVTRATALNRKILTFGRDENKHLAPINLQTVTEEVVRLLRSSLPSTIALRSECEAGLPPVTADANQIHQLLMNLCTNAFHAMEGKTGSIDVRVEGCHVTDDDRALLPELSSGNYVRVSVSDEGCGMDEKTLGHIFEPFFTTKPSGKGTGLGLSVVHGIMSNHKGTITVDSRIGRGTTFHLYFPLT